MNLFFKKWYKKTSHLFSQEYLNIPDNFPPTVSFTFDDVPSSSLNGAKILFDEGISATFYICFDKLESPLWDETFVNLKEVQTLIDLGHEIACHTSNHIDLFDYKRNDFINSINRNKLLAKKIGLSLNNFSYPKGRIKWDMKKKINNKFDTARSTKPGINTGRIDKGALLACPLYSNPSNKNINKIKENIDSMNPGDWLIIYTHDVKENPTRFGCSQENLTSLIHHIKEKNIATSSISHMYSSLTKQN